MITKFLVAKQYTEAYKKHQELEHTFNAAFKLLDQDNQVYLGGSMQNAYDNLVEQLLSSELFEYVLSWIFEHDHGKNIDLDFNEYFDSHISSYKNEKH
jgi:hypothetical protein